MTRNPSSGPPPPYSRAPYPTPNRANERTPLHHSERTRTPRPNYSAAPDIMINIAHTTNLAISQPSARESHAHHYYLGSILLFVLVLVPLIFTSGVYCGRELGLPANFPNSTERDRIREGWYREEAEHERQRKQWEQERKQHEDKHEKGPREKFGLHWEDPTRGQHCLRYGTREYTAKLKNLPFFVFSRVRISGCKETPIEIGGKVYPTPDQCEDLGFFGGVRGHWHDVNELSCMPYWGDFSNKGCTVKGSGVRRMRSRLWNIESGEDWKSMCATTPADIHGVHFPSPKYCEDQGILGVHGIWELEDANC